jgi:UTP--glucose-1-phosphate uridylyltransferase
MLKDGHNFFGCLMQNSRRYDTGDKLEYLITVVEFALRHKDLGVPFREHVEKLLKQS